MARFAGNRSAVSFCALLTVATQTSAQTSNYFELLSSPPVGIPELHSIPEFLEALKLLHAVGPLPGREICSISCSGGEASLIADTAEGRGVRFRALTASERASVKATLGPIVTVANPLDYHTFIWDNEPAMTATFGVSRSVSISQKSGWPLYQPTKSTEPNTPRLSSPGLPSLRTSGAPIASTTAS